ncbi:unnamed protein product [Rhizoctonia solani]|uniref:Protein kinase domain-containing protein n=1 Tax=Rhizoctonia solani TaxID=456999 RepID=A0A8H3DNC8_9AGAM|nr:unnamed protein product [Rhizoctonia solani]
MDSATSTNQFDWQNVVAQLAGYGCLDVSSKISRSSDLDIVIAGGFYDIYMGKLAGYDGSVAVKYTYSNNQGLASLINEVRITSRLQYLNVIPFLGFVLKPSEPREDAEQGSVKRLLDIGLVSPWVEFSLYRWIRSKENNINRCQLAVQVAEAVIHLHDAGIIHGDLRSRSIMVSSEGTMQITGFGSSVLEQDTPDETVFRFAPRWAAPERFYRKSGWPTKKSDIWSLGMVILELFSNQVPYQGMSELRAIAFIGDGRIPEQRDSLISIKPGFKRILWGLLLSCWQRIAEDRPSANVVRDILSIVNREGAIHESNQPTPTVIEHTLPLPTIIERLVEHGCSDVTRQLTKLHDTSEWSGRMSDVYQTRLLDGTRVAVKCLREFKNSENQPDKHTAHELYTWSMSTHPNVLELIGLAVVRDRLAMVAPWVEYGSLLAYIGANPTADRCNLVADGLAYMHSLDIAHGDIKGDNVVVSKDGIAKITDFGCATMKREFPVAFTATDSLNYSVRWAAPELFLDDGATNFETDVYALGMVDNTSWCFKSFHGLDLINVQQEAITGNVPHKDRADMAVIHAVLVRKQQPARPLERVPKNRKGDELWGLLERCWSYEPKSRPKASDVRDSDMRGFMAELEDRHHTSNSSTSNPLSLRYNTGSTEKLCAFGPSMELGDAICELAKYQCLDLTEKVAFLGNEDDIDVIGGFYDIFKASLIGYEGVVAVKCSGNAVLEHIVNELRVVSKLEHSNVLPCLGYIVTDLRRSSSYDRLPNQHIIGIVYPWIDLNLRDYLKLRPSANRAYLCNQVIEGLQYLHDTEVIHGDLRGRTIMISGQGTVQITGFGGSVLREDPPGHGNNFQMAGRWAAPERMLAVGAEPTIKADIWSLGMESFTGDMPYPELSELHALVAVADGRIPARPDKLINVKAGYSEILWELLLLCFQFVPGDRPALKSVRDIMTVIQREGQVNTEVGSSLRAHSNKVNLFRTQENDTNHTTIKRTTTLPTIIDRLVDQGCLDVTKQLRYMDESPKYSGALSDVYQARLFNGKLVAVKCLRALTNSESKPEKVFKRTAREIYAWSIATHPNILELEGLAVFRDKLAMDNVVVSNEGMAKITDFGCATMRRDFPVAFTATESLSYSVRWAAPELFLDEGIKTNYETDVYALGMEVLTGNVPHKDKADLAVIHTVVFRKEHPARPVDCIPPHSAKGDELWSMLGRCWSYEPRLRPKASEVRDFVSATKNTDTFPYSKAFMLIILVLGQLNSMTQSELAI